MTKPDILLVSPYPKDIETLLEQHFTLHRLHEASDPAAMLATLAPRIRALATTGGKGASADLIAALPALEIISVFGVGFDAVDLEAARARAIAVTNTPDVLTDDVADLAIGMWLDLMRGITPAHRFVAEGAWKRAPFPLMRKAGGTRAGIIGLGRIGEAIGRRLEGFGAAIAYHSRQPKSHVSWRFEPDVVALAGTSDVLFVASAATAETRHIVNAKVLEALGAQGLVINISRAANIDEEALLAALETGRIRGACLDVFEGEPDINPRFLALDSVLLQPHQGSGTVETRRAMGQLVFDNLLAHFTGQPLLTPVL